MPPRQPFLAGMLPIGNAAWFVWLLASRGGDPLAATADIHAASDIPAQQLADIAKPKGGSDKLTQWFDTVPAESRSGLANHFLYRLISSAPQVAVNFMTKNAQDSWRDDRHAGILIDMISQQDPAGTAAIHPSPVGTPLEQTPVFQAASRWAKPDPEKARVLLDANSHEPRAETARAGFTRSVAEVGDDLISR